MPSSYTNELPFKPENSKRGLFGNIVASPQADFSNRGRGGRGSGPTIYR